MASNLALVFDILAKDNASATFRKVGDSAEKSGKQAEGFGGKITGAAKGADAAVGALKGAAAAFAGTAIIGAFKNVYDAAAESQKIARLTENAIRSTGGAAKVSAQQVGDLAGAIAAKTGIDDEAIQTGENLLLTFTNIRNEAGKGNDIFNQTTQIMTDMSAVLGTDASGSAIQLGKALNDPIKGVSALTKVGVSFTAQQKDQIKTLVESGDTLGAQKVILAELSKEFGGAAEAAATPLDKLQVQVGNVAESMGGYLVPAVDKAATLLSDKMLPAFSGIGATVAGVGIPAFTALADVVGGLAEAFNALPAPLQSGVVALGAIAALKGPLTGVFETVALRAMYLKDTLTGLSLNMSGLKAAGGGLLSFFGGPWGLAITGATIGLTALVSWLGKTDEATQNTEQATKDYATALASANGVIDESVRKAAAKAAQDAGLLDMAKDLGISLPQVTDAITTQGSALDSTRSRLAAYMGQHTIMLDANTRGLDSEGEAAKRALDALNGLAGQTGVTTSEQKQLAEATADSGTAMTGSKDPAAALRSSLEDVATAASDAKTETNLFKTALDVLTGAHVSMIEVESAFQATLAQATGAMKDMSGAVLDGSGQLNTQSEAGRKAADVLLDVRNSGNDLIATMEQQGATSEEVAAKDASLRSSFIQTAIQMGIGQREANKLADQILGIPAERTTEINADTADAAYDISALQGQINELAKDRVASINFRATLPDLNGAASGSGRPGLAEGGMVPGTYVGPKADNVLIRANPREFMQPVAAVQHYGVDFMEAIRTRKFPRFANGGLVAEDRSQVGAGFYGSLGRGIIRGANGELTRAANWRDYVQSEDGSWVAPAFYGPVTLAAKADTSGALSGISAFSDKLASAVKQGMQSMTAAVATGPGGGAERWRPVVLQALGMLGQSPALANGVLRMISAESGGNPNAINLWDSNAKAGHPSRGLMQTIPGTFAAYRNPYLPNNIVDPLANIYSGINYALHRYGPGMLAAGGRSSGGRYVGYETGTDYVPVTGPAVLHKGEAVLTAAENAARRGPVEITGTLQIGGDGLARIIDGRIVGAVSGIDRGLARAGVRA